MHTRTLAVALGAFLPLLAVGAGTGRADDRPETPSDDRPAIRIGAVAYAPAP